MSVVLVIVAIILVQQVNFQVYSKTLAILKDLIACLSVSYLSHYLNLSKLRIYLSINGFVL